MAGAVFGLAASLITFRGLWAAARTPTLGYPPVVTSDEDGNRQEEKDAGAVVKEAEPHAVDMSGSESTSSYVEVKGAQA